VGASAVSIGGRLYHLARARPVDVTA
jgi:hypothetical protein